MTSPTGPVPRPLPDRPSVPPRSSLSARRAALTAALASLLAFSAVACGSGDASSSTASGGTSAASRTSAAGTRAAATSTPPDGSGATVPGLVGTAPPAIIPSGATKTLVACRQMYPAINDAITAWNAANSSNDTTALGKAAEALAKSAGAIPAMAKESGDAKLIQLTDAAVAQLKKVVTDYENNSDVDGTALNKAATDVWTYCQSAR